MCDTLKVVKIELALEGRELSLLEELPHYLVFELAWTMNHERPAMRQPRDDVLLSEPLDDFQNDLELHWECAANVILTVEAKGVLVAFSKVLDDVIRVILVTVLDEMSLVALGGETHLFILHCFGIA